MEFEQHASSGVALNWWLPAAVPVAALLLLIALGAGWTVILVALVLHGAGTFLVHRLRDTYAAPFGWASRVTLARSGLVAVLAAALVQPELYGVHGWTMAALALLALGLDGLDGWLARRLGETSAFGARLDMEVDAALIAVLCLSLAATGKVGAWVLAIGLMRYAFVAAARLWPWLGAPLPTRFRRKLVCVWQVAALLICLTPAVAPSAATAILASALALLAVSFMIDIAWLRRCHRQARIQT